MTLDLNAIKARVDKAFASLSKAHPYLVKHADHVDGEFDLALSTLRQEIERLTAERDEAVTAHGKSYLKVVADLDRLTADHAALRTAVREWQEAHAGWKKWQTADSPDERQYARYVAAKNALSSFPVEEAP